MKYRRIKCTLLVAGDWGRWMLHPVAEICRNVVRRDDPAASGRRMPSGTEMVVLFIIKHLHFPCGSADRPALACVCLPLVSEGARICSKWPKAKRTEGRPPGQGVRGHLYDRGKGLGWRAYIRTNYYRSHSRKCQKNNLNTHIIYYIFN